MVNSTDFPRSLRPSSPHPFLFSLPCQHKSGGKKLGRGTAPPVGHNNRKGLIKAVKASALSRATEPAAASAPVPPALKSGKRSVRFAPDTAAPAAAHGSGRRDRATVGKSTKPVKRARVDADVDVEDLRDDREIEELERRLGMRRVGDKRKANVKLGKDLAKIGLGGDLAELFDSIDDLDAKLAGVDSGDDDDDDDGSSGDAGESSGDYDDSDGDGSGGSTGGDSDSESGSTGRGSDGDDADGDDDGEAPLLVPASSAPSDSEPLRREDDGMKLDRRGGTEGGKAGAIG